MTSLLFFLQYFYFYKLFNHSYRIFSMRISHNRLIKYNNNLIKPHQNKQYKFILIKIMNKNIKYILTNNILYQYL